MEDIARNFFAEETTLPQAGVQQGVSEDHVTGFAVHRYDRRLRIQVFGIPVRQEAVRMRTVNVADQERQSMK